MFHIFVSYSRKELAIAENIIDALAQDDLEPWIDWKSIPKGEKFEEEIYQGIEESEIFLFLVSPDSTQSEWCNKEIDHAVKNGKRILPIVIRDTDPRIIHPEISKRNWIFCRDGQDDFKEALVETHKTIHTDYEWLKYHTELQVKALRWEQKKDTSRLLRGKELREAEEWITKAGNQKDPLPTELHRNFLLVSQRKEIHQRRQITIRLSIGLVIVAVLAIFAWAERNTAVTEANSRATAESNAISEANAKATALVNEENARLSAQAEKMRAEEQARIALARQLAAEGQLMFSQVPSGPFISTILGIESLKIMPSVQADQVVRWGLRSLPKPLMRYSFSPDTVGDVEFSHTGEIFAISADNSIYVFDSKTFEQIAKWEVGPYVDDLVISSDESMIMSGGHDGIARVWDIKTGKEISRMKSSGTDLAIDLSPNNYLAVVGGGDGIIRVWEIDSGIEIAQMLHRGSVTDVNFSPTGDQIVSAGGDRVVIVWEAKSGKELFRKTYNFEIVVVSFSPDSSLIATGDFAGELRVWDWKNGLELVKSELEDWITCISFSHDGTKILSGSDDDSVLVIDISTGNEIMRVHHDFDVKDVAFSLDDTKVISGSWDGTVRVWEVSTGAELSRMPLNGNVDNIAISSSGRIIAGDWEGVVSIWELDNNNDEITIFPYKNVKSISELPNGDLIALIANWYSVRVINIAKNSALFNINIKDWTTAVDLSMASNVIAVSDRSDPNRLHIWDIDTGSLKYSIQEQQPIELVKFNAKGNQFVTLANNKILRLWNTSSGKLLDSIEVNGNSKIVQFSPRGAIVAYIDVLNGYSIRGWNLENGNVDNIMNIPSTSIITAIDFSPNEDRIAVGNRSGLIQVWSLKSGEEVAQMRHDTSAVDGITDISFSPDGQYLISGSWDGTSRVWDAETGVELARLVGDRFDSVLFSVSTNRVISIAFWGDVKSWIWTPPDLISEACNHLPRNFTLTEWQQYIGANIPYHATCPNLPVISGQN